MIRDLRRYSPHVETCDEAAGVDLPDGKDTGFPLQRTLAAEAAVLLLLLLRLGS